MSDPEGSEQGPPEVGSPERMKQLTERYFPYSERYLGPVVHRSLVADAFRAGVAAVIEPLIDPLDRALDDEAVADAFEEWCEEAFTE